MLQRIEDAENKRHGVEKCPFCKKLAVVKKPYTKGAGYFYQCTYCGAVKANIENRTLKEHNKYGRK